MPRLRAWSAATVLMALLASACNITTREAQTVTRTIELDAAESLTADLSMGAGELDVSGGAATLLQASFRITDSASEPKIDYQKGALRIEQPGGGLSFGRSENHWTLNLNDTVPLDLTARLGAGRATLNLGTLNLRSVDLQIGAGEVHLDLRGRPRQSFTVDVSGGVGTARILVPRDVGIAATAKGGLGSIRVKGLEQRGDTWHNPGHDGDPVMIRLDIKGGVGDIVISAE